MICYVSAISDFSLSLSLSLFVLVCLMCRFHTIFCYSCFQTTLWHSMNICYPMFWKQFPHFALKTTTEFLFILSCCGNARNTHKLRRITIHLAIGKKMRTSENITNLFPSCTFFSSKYLLGDYLLHSILWNGI